MSRPLAFAWDGEAMLPKQPRLADKEYVIGQIYTMVEVNERSVSSHNHEFAWLKSAWENLPEDLADLYPTVDHLRKRALIEGGFYDEQIVDAGSNAAAVRVAAAFRTREEFSLVVVRGPLVLLRTAKSQSRRAMDKETFEASKRAILEIVSGMIGVSPDALSQSRAA